MISSLQINQIVNNFKTLKLLEQIQTRISFSFYFKFKWSFSFSNYFISIISFRLGFSFNLINVSVKSFVTVYREDIVRHSHAHSSPSRARRADVTCDDNVNVDDAKPTRRPYTQRTQTQIQAMRQGCVTPSKNLPAAPPTEVLIWPIKLHPGPGSSTGPGNSKILTDALQTWQRLSCVLNSVGETKTSLKTSKMHSSCKSF